MTAPIIRTARFSFVCAIVLCAFAVLAPNAVGQTTAQWLNPISTPTFVNVYWDQMWDGDSPGMTMNQIDDFTSALVNSTYFSALAEYGVTSVSFSPRSFVANPLCGDGGTAPHLVPFISPFYIPPVFPLPAIGTPGITQFMTCEIELGGVPTGANIIYNLFLPPQTLEQDTFLDQGIPLPGTFTLCLHGHPTAYHFFVPGPGLRNAFTVIFANPNCNEPPGPPDFAGLTENLSHEMVEATTDPVPLVSLVLSAGTDEIGDLCIPNSGFSGAPANPPGFLQEISGGTTEMYWSNAMQTCVSGYSSRTGPSFSILSGLTGLSLIGSGFGTLPSITSFSNNVGTSVNITTGPATIPYLAVQDVDQSGTQVRWEAGNSLNGDPILLSMTWLPTKVNASLTSVPPPPMPGDSLKAIACNPASGVCSSRELPFPNISQLSPNGGPAAGGTEVMISGQGFSGDTSSTVVFFGSTQATPDSVSPNLVTVKTPMSRPGNVNVSLVSQGLPSNGASFLYCHPQVSQVMPNSSPMYKATPVTITGSCFTGATSVSFGAAGEAFVGTPEATVVADNLVSATAPAWSNGGCKVNVQVMSPDLDGLVGGSGSSGSLFFYGPPNRCFNPNEYGAPLSFCFQNPGACPSVLELSSLITAGNPQPENFGDLAGYEWAASAINAIASQGVLHGTSAQKFSPGQAVTRGDFATGLMRTLSFRQTPDISFSDVEARDSAHPIYAEIQPYMTTFADRTGSISFNAALPLERQEVALSIVSLLVTSKKTKLVEGKAAEAILNQFQDNQLIAGALRPYVATAIQNRILIADATSRSWRPVAFMTRAEFAVAIARIEEFFKKKK